MKRSIANLVVLLLLGAIVNVAVAWGCAAGIAQNPTLRDGIALLDTGHHWTVERRATTGRTILVSTLWTGFASRYMADCKADELIPTWGRIRRPALPRGETWTDPNSGRVFEVSQQAFMEFVDIGAGWPALCLWGGFGTDVVTSMPGDGSSFQNVIGGIVIQYPSIWGFDGVLFPLRPIWTGFTINTLFYAAILWLLFGAPLALRRWRRAKRGLCMKCAYDLRGSPADSQMCPECGAPLPGAHNVS